MAFRNKVKKAIKTIGFKGEYEIISRNYGYEVKVYGAEEDNYTNLANVLNEIMGYGNYIVIARKKYASIRCEL